MIFKGLSLLQKIFLLLFLPFIFIGCSSQQKNDQITISTNQWIGYTPLFYAYEKGYLKDLNVKIINSVSLAEAADIYRVGQANMVTTTQHEYNVLRESTHNIVPVILLDRSNGGDMILSNRSIDALKKSKHIYAYLEVDSINQEILKSFIENNGMNIDKFTIINKDQEQIQDVDFKKLQNRDLMIVTYSPYDIDLKVRGFHEIASTKNIDSIIVIDALCSTKELFKNHKDKLIKLKEIVDRSIDEIRQNPLQAHKITMKYLSNMSYKEFLSSLDNIKWINKPSDQLLEYIDKYHYTKETLLK